MMSQCAAWLWVSKLVALALARFVAAEVVVVGIVRMAVVVAVAGDMVAVRMAVAVVVAAAVGRVRKVS